jgi:methanogenic corrinoid protein MtbC1
VGTSCYPLTAAKKQTTIKKKMNALSEPASHLFISEFGNLSAVVLKRLELEWRYHKRPDLAKADQQILQNALEFGRLLKVVYRHHLFSVLHEESQWYAGVFAARGSSHDVFELLLDSWIIAIQGVIKPPECNELAQPIRAIRDSLPLLITQAQQQSRTAPEPAVLLLLESLVRGDVRGGREVLLGMAAKGTPPEKLIVEVMLPAMAEIGRRWELNEMEIFQEHLATEAIQSLLSGLPLLMTGAAPKQMPSALVSCVPGEEHALIPLALAAYLEFKGWPVKNLGRNLPSAQIVRAVSAFSPEVLFLTFTTISRLDEAMEVIEQCHAASIRCRIILGGRGAIATKAILEKTGALVASDFEQGFHLAAEGAKDA